MFSFLRRTRHYLQIEDGPQFIEAPAISPPTTREGIADLMQRIDDRRVAWHVAQAKKEWDGEQAALRNAATEILKAYDEYRGGDDVAFVPPAIVVEKLRAALEAPQ